MAPPLARFGQRHPLLGGVVAAAVWGGAMFLIFSVLTHFEFETLMAVLWSIGGIAFGAILGWTWSRARRAGENT
jgi:hypothetical protein